MNTEQQNQDSFKDTILSNVAFFANSVSKRLTALFSLQCSSVNPEFIEENLGQDRSLFFSILFTGTVFGEFILALDEETAIKIAGSAEEASPENRAELLQDAVDGLSELLNIAVGESIVGLNNLYKKLTITAPKVHFGQVRYPRVKSGKVILKCDKGDIDCYLYIDRMKLDISASYKQVLVSLMNANKELKEAMIKLEEQQNHLILSEKMAALGMMAAGVAHEINTPLATISLLDQQMKDLLGDEETDKAQLVEMLDMIETTISRISKITQALRAYAHDRVKEPFQIVAAKKIVDETLLLCTVAIKNSGIKLISPNIPETLAIECRPHELSQVFLNLLLNSCDAVQSLPEKWIKIEVADHETEIEFSVTDSGSGLPPQIRNKVFDPFFTTKELGKGTGLGLSLSKGIIDTHHGTIAVNSKSPNTQFVVRLPKKQKSSSPKAA